MVLTEMGSEQRPLRREVENECIHGDAGGRGEGQAKTPQAADV